MAITTQEIKAMLIEALAFSDDVTYAEQRLILLAVINAIIVAIDSDKTKSNEDQ